MMLGHVFIFQLLFASAHADAAIAIKDAGGVAVCLAGRLRALSRTLGLLQDQCIYIYMCIYMAVSTLL